MNMERTTTIVVVGAAVAVLWGPSGKSVTGRTGDSRMTNPSAVATRGEMIAREISFLHPLRPAVKPRQPGRDLFSFVSTKGRPVPDVARTALDVQVSTTALPRTVVNLPALKLSGIAEDATANGVVRTAIISGFGQLFVAKEGEQVTARYRIVRISADVVELIDIQDAITFRLALR
jgi:hypothetical protein